MSYKDALGDHAILRRITGLKTVRFKSRPSKYSSSPEAFARKDQGFDGEFLEDFDQNVIPGAVTILAPYWNDIKDTYWVENRGILTEIIDDIRPFVRYPDNHPSNPGMVIKGEDVDPGNYWDPFFQADILKQARMESGKYVFELQKSPIDVLLFYSYMHNPWVIVKDGSEVSKYVAGRARFELIIPKQEMMETKATLKKEADALEFLNNMSYDKQKHVAYIMKLRLNDYVHPNPDELYVALGSAAKETEKKRASWGTTYQDKFLQTAKLSNNDLLLMVDITKALDLRVITIQRGEYLLNSEVLENVKTDSQLFHFFKNDDNSDKYKQLTFHLGEKDKQPT